MNREVLFRAWYEKEKRMFNNVYILGDDILCALDELDPNGLDLIADINDVILEQYTGLKDKNGTKIFEGDRVIYLPYGDIFKVYWSNETFGWQLECIESSEGDVGWVEYLSEFGSKDLEVIGNIHDKEVSK